MHTFFFIIPYILVVSRNQRICCYFNRKRKILFIFLTKKEAILTYSTVDKSGCRYARLNADFFFCFTITQRTPHLNVRLYSEYQIFLYQTITEQRDEGKTFDQIAEWLNKKGYLSVRGKKFKGNHIHSIVKKKRLKDEKLEREYPEVWSDFSLEVVDKTLVNNLNNRGRYPI